MDSPAAEFFRSKLGYVKSPPPEGVKRESVKHELPKTEECAGAIAQIVETIEFKLQEFAGHGITGVRARRDRALDAHQTGGPIAVR